MRLAARIFFLALAFAAPAHAGLPPCPSPVAKPAPGESYAAFRARAQRENCTKDWTVLVYMEADNDLFPYALRDLTEMERPFAAAAYAGSTYKSDLLVEVNGPAADDRRRLQIFAAPSPAASAPTSLAEIQSPVAMAVPENDGASPEQRLTKFLLWGAAQYPAEHYFVVVWGHGQGWKAYPVANPLSGGATVQGLASPYSSAAPDENFGGIGFSQSDGRSLDIPALRSALGSLHQAIGHPVDVYASDACLMQMLEVAYELNAEARFIVGSSQTQNFLGLPYRRILYELNSGRFHGQHQAARGSADQADEAYFLAQMIPPLMKESLDPNRGSHGGPGQQDAERWVTSSALSSLELQQTLIPAFRDLAASLAAYVQEDSLRALNLQYLMQKTPAPVGGAQDLSVFLQFANNWLAQAEAKAPLTTAGQTLRASLAAAEDALDRAVLAYSYGAAYGLDQSLLVAAPRAVSLWLPGTAKEHGLRRGEFLLSHFYAATGWNSWLDLVYKQP